MVKQLKLYGLILFCFSLSSQSFAFLKISQKDAAELALKQSAATKEVNLNYIQKRLNPQTALSAYDWKLDLESGYEKDQLATFPSDNLSFERYKTTASLKKSLVTGTSLSLDFSRISQKADLGAAQATTPNQATLDVLGLSVEQNLFANFFGVADRATIRAAETSFKADNIIRADELQNIVLETLSRFWKAYVAQETLKENKLARDRYKDLVANVKRKKGYGYSNPGELSQVQAELESHEQTLNQSQVDYLASIEDFKAYLNIASKEDLQFEIPKETTAPPLLVGKDIQSLRKSKSQSMKVEAAQDALTASKSKSWPYLSFVGQLNSSGLGDNSNSSWAKATGGANNKYYTGLKLTYNFGSDFQTEDIINKKAMLDLEQSKFTQLAQETANGQEQAARAAKSGYEIAESAKLQRSFRESTVSELTRTYNQGRSDLKNLIDALNLYFQSEVSYIKAIGDYQIALNKWAAVRDELISGFNEENPILKSEGERHE